MAQQVRRRRWAALVVRSLVVFGAVAYGLVSLCSLQSQAQQTVVPRSKLGLDTVRTTANARLVGFILDHSPDGGLTMAVERAWLREHFPDLAAQRLASEEDERNLVVKTIRERTAEWISERAADFVLVRTLEDWLKELEPTESAIPSEFCVFRFQKEDYTRFDFATPTNRKIAGLAYQHQIPDIATTSVTTLARKLNDANVDIHSENVDLADRLSTTASDTLQQWRVRQAFIEHHFRKSLEFQGDGSTLYRVGEERNLMELVGQVMASSSTDSISALGAELGLPEFRNAMQPNDAWKKVVESAEADGFRGVLIKQLKTTTTKVAVQVQFFVMESPGNWFLAVDLSAAADPSNQPADRIQRIKADPQVQQVIGIAETLGVGSRLEQALQQGAATQIALETASAQFDQLLVRYLKGLDSPPISIPMR